MRGMPAVQAREQLPQAHFPLLPRVQQMPRGVCPRQVLIQQLPLAQPPGGCRPACSQMRLCPICTRKVCIHVSKVVQRMHSLGGPRMARWPEQMRPPALVQATTVQNVAVRILRNNIALMFDMHSNHLTRGCDFSPGHLVIQPSTPASRACRWPSCSRQFRWPLRAALRPPSKCPAAARGPTEPGLRASWAGPSPALCMLPSFLRACSYSVSAADQEPAFSAASICKCPRPQLGCLPQNIYGAGRFQVALVQCNLCLTAQLLMMVVWHH